MFEFDSDVDETVPLGAVPACGRFKTTDTNVQLAQGLAAAIQA